VTAPRFSVVTAVFDPDPAHLRAAIASVRDQRGVGQGGVGLGGVGRITVEHVLVDDGSTRPGVREVLDEAERDPYTIVVRRDANGGIVAASNDALARATGEFVVLLDHDDVLATSALSTVAAVVDAADGTSDPIDVLYSDHDLIRPDGRRASPVFKPDFSLERLRNHNYITHLVVARRTAIVDVGGFTPGTDGAQDHDLLLRLAEAVGPFTHVPQILLHWRQSPASVATSSENKPEASERQRKVTAAHLERSGIDARVEVGTHPGVVRIRRSLPEPRPLVSLIIPTNGARGRPWGAERVFVLDAVSSILDAHPGRAPVDADPAGSVSAGSRDVGRQLTDGAGTPAVDAEGAGDDDPGVDIEVVVMIDDGTDPLVERALRTIAGDRLVVVPYDLPYNFADKINVGVAASSGSHVLLLNDDTQLITPHGIAEMVAIAEQRDVGMVGAKLLFADGTLQHGGHVYNDMVSHAMLGWPGDHPGPHRLLAVERECSGVTAAAALLRREVFDEVGGMDVEFAINYNDVDFSLRILEVGYRIIWTPHASWFHFEQQSGDHPVDRVDVERLEQRWGDALRNDRFSNPNLAPGRCDWLERPGLAGSPPYEVLADGRTSWG